MFAFYIHLATNTPQNWMTRLCPILKPWNFLRVIFKLESSDRSSVCVSGLWCGILASSACRLEWGSPLMPPSLNTSFSKSPTFDFLNCFLWEIFDSFEFTPVRDGWLPMCIVFHGRIGSQEEKQKAGGGIQRWKNLQFVQIYISANVFKYI